MQKHHQVEETNETKETNAELCWKSKASYKHMFSSLCSMVTMQLTDPHVLVSLGLRLLEACLMISRLRQMYVDVFFSYIYIYIYISICK